MVSFLWPIGSSVEGAELTVSFGVVCADGHELVFANVQGLRGVNAFLDDLCAKVGIGRGYWRF